MEKINYSQRSITSYLGRKRQNTTLFDNSLFRPLISSEPKNEYESVLWLYKNMLGVDWTDKFIKDNQQFLDNISPNALWFLYSSTFFPHDFKELSGIDETSLKELFSIITRENETLNIKKSSCFKTKLNFYEDINSLSKEKYLYGSSLVMVENQISSILNGVRRINESKIEKLQKMIPKITTVDYCEGLVPSKSLLRDCTIQNETLYTVNQYCDFLYKQSQKMMESYVNKERIFDVASEIKDIKDEDDWMCFICNNGDIDDNQLIYECESCAVTVHQSCYGIKTNKVEHWKCDCCKELDKEKGQELECILCSVKGGAMKRADLPKDSSFVKNLMKIRNKENNIPKYNSHIVVPINDYSIVDCCWVHLSCALWNPNISFAHFEEKTGIKCIEMIDYSAFYDYCNVCKKEGYGPTIKCNHKDCKFRAHPECARMNKYHLEVVNEKGTLNYNIYCYKHQPVNLVKNIIRRYAQKEEDIKDFSILLKKIYKGYEREYRKSLLEIKPQIRPNTEMKNEDRDLNLILGSSMTTRQSANNNYTNSISSCSNSSSQCQTKPSISSLTSKEKVGPGLNKTQLLFIRQFKSLARRVTLCSKIFLSKNKDPISQDVVYSLIKEKSANINLSYQEVLSKNFPWEELNFKSFSSNQARQYFLKIIPDGITYYKLILKDPINSNQNEGDDGKNDEDDNHIYCYCKQKYYEDDIMICCEKGKKCLGSYNGWFHLSCIDELRMVPQEEIVNVKFICNSCLKEQL